MTSYQGWSSVPAHLMTKSSLADLEYPRTADGSEPAGWVDARDAWRGKEDTFALYDARSCAPTGSTGGQLRSAAQRAERASPRVCEDCGAHCQRSLAAGGEGIDARPLCPACRHIARIRAEQATLARHRARTAGDVAALLAGPPLAVVQVDLHEPPLTDAGRRRPVTAGRVRACELDGRRLLDVTVRLVSLRSKWVPAGALDPAEVLPQLRRALADRRLVAWSHADLAGLRQVDPGGGYPGEREEMAWSPLTDRYLDNTDAGSNLAANRAAARAAARSVVIGPLAEQWRGQLDPRTRRLVPCFAPGTPDRLALMLVRMAASVDSSALVSTTSAT